MQFKLNFQIARSDPNFPWRDCTLPSHSRGLAESVSRSNGIPGSKRNSHSQRVGACFDRNSRSTFWYHVLAGLHLALTLGRHKGKAFYLHLIMASVADGRSKTRTLADLRSASQRVHPWHRFRMFPWKSGVRECNGGAPVTVHAMSQPLCGAATGMNLSQ